MFSSLDRWKSAWPRDRNDCPQVPAASRAPLTQSFTPTPKFPCDKVKYEKKLFISISIY